MGFERGLRFLQRADTRRDVNRSVDGDGSVRRLRITTLCLPLADGFTRPDPADTILSSDPGLSISADWNVMPKSPSRETPAGLTAALRDSPFLKACRREPAEVTPIWLMRQAGRYMAEYRAIRAKVPFLELCKRPELATEVTVTAAEVLGVDAAILFADILLILEPLGFDLEFAKGEGPVIHNPVREPRDVDRVRPLEDPEPLSFVYEAVSSIRSALKPTIPLIGFAGAPFTLACYAIEGGGSRHYQTAKTFMYRDPGAWNALMDRLVDSTVLYLNAQIAAGAQAVQLFDSWVGIPRPRRLSPVCPAAHGAAVLPARSVGPVHPLRHRHRRPSGAPARGRRERDRPRLARRPGTFLAPPGSRRRRAGKPRPDRPLRTVARDRAPDPPHPRARRQAAPATSSIWAMASCRRRPSIMCGPWSTWSTRSLSQNPDPTYLGQELAHRRWGTELIE